MKKACLTVCSLNYIKKALVLAESYSNFNPSDDFYLLIVDRKRNDIDVPGTVNLLWVEDLGIDGWEKYAFSYDVVEFNTNVKPWALRTLLESYEKIVFLDPDIEVFGSFESVWNQLDECSILLTPHYFSPLNDGKKPDDLELLKFGPFNLGFVAVSRCNEAMRFLEWWSDRCLEAGFYEPQSGLAVDQKWVSLAPGFFQKIKVSFDYGLNVAFWNLHEREFSRKGEDILVNEKDKLIFIHFSALDLRNPQGIANKQDRFNKGDCQFFSKLAESYSEKVESVNVPGLDFSKTVYSFDYFDDGTYITPALRRFYSIFRDSEVFIDGSPFASSGSVMRFAKKNKLIGVRYRPSRHLNFKDVPETSLSVKTIAFFLKFALRVLGPMNYFALMRYMGFMSSIRRQSKIVKI